MWRSTPHFVVFSCRLILKSENFEHRFGDLMMRITHARSMNFLKHVAVATVGAIAAVADALAINEAANLTSVFRS